MKTHDDVTGAGAYRRAALAIALSVLAAPATAAAAAAPPAVAAHRPRAPAVAVLALEVSFKLDPRITKSLYMGERWVSPAVYTSPSVVEGKSVVVLARARGLDAGGLPSRIPARWIPADPGMIAVTPSVGDEVQITVQRAGQSRLTVEYAGLSRSFVVTTVRQAGHWRADISGAAEAPSREGS